VLNSQISLSSIILSLPVLLIFAFISSLVNTLNHTNNLFSSNILKSSNSFEKEVGLVPSSSHRAFTHLFINNTFPSLLVSELDSI
jgi:membrane-bound metal-dependent hydrolase YbcI (DUF457 family)